MWSRHRRTAALGLDDETQLAAMRFLAGRDGVADGRQVAAREHPAARTSRAAADA
jgi:hypothetical protein